MQVSISQQASGVYADVSLHKQGNLKECYMTVATDREGLSTSASYLLGH